MTTNGIGPADPNATTGQGTGAPTGGSAGEQLPAVIHSTAAPQGWYPDGTAPGVQRWWDGARWTDHVYDTTAGTYRPPVNYGGAPAAQLAPDTSPYNPFIWVVVLVPLLSLVAFLSWDMTAYIHASMNLRSGQRGGSTALLSSLGAGYYLVNAAGLIVYAATVVFSALDHRRLGQQGFPRRFHWAWSFLGSLVYVIGRTVVVRSQIGRGWAVLWVFIAVDVLAFVIILVKVFAAVGAAMPSLGAST